MNRRVTSKIALFITTAILLGSAVAISRDYQDSWVLEGLEIPFLLFVITYLMAFFSERRLSWMVILAIIGRVVFLLIPNLKYVWFQGKAIDQHQQYALANHVYNEGYIGPSGISIYTDTPLIHLTFAIFSIVLKIPVLDSFKYIPVFLSPIFPLCTYVIMKRLKFIQGTSALKYGLLVSSIPITAEKYVVSGSQFGVRLSFVVLTSLVMLLEKKDRRRGILFIFLISVLAMTHSTSSVLITTLILGIMLLQKVPHFQSKLHLKASTAIAVASISAAWFMFKAKSTLEAITRVIFIKVRIGTTPRAGYVPPRFFELAKVNILEAMKAILVLNGAEILLLFLTLGGLLVVAKMRKQVISKFLFLIGGLMILYIPLGFLLKLEGFRVLHLATPLFPIFSGVFIFHRDKTRVWKRAIIFSSIILLATLDLYSCQPLIPSANVLLKDLPPSEPIVYVTDVNSIYQRQMIEFARIHVGGRIACDYVTFNQIRGLTELDFSVTHLTWYYPLDKDQPERKYDCFLIHLPGIAGPFAEKAEMRTRDSILEAIYGSTVVYSNSESYMLTHNSP